MDNNRFSWDENKYISNMRKHGVNFHEAATVFDDLSAVLEEDEQHSYDEERFTIIGMSEETRILMVCHCYRENDKIRIISARKANKKEIKKYQN
ncbi:MAG: BrnT family toxin [Defluviitaleaceae bacterium]|nr:BrnT family toxin [Defluviitaleaceae bacterium]